ncbi:hypothetical protein Syun_024493 [Stephania yunnanensis]|uniref:Cytochrome P450 n=1 Tax=Stephania yunnanensis TaxID=152371 RepID=A0AAP0I4G5_9MAGN
MKKPMTTTRPYLISNLALLLILLLLCLGLTHQLPSLILLSLSYAVLSFFFSTTARGGGGGGGGLAWRKHPTNLPGPIGWPLIGSIPTMGTLAHRKLASLSTSLGATRLMAFSLGAKRVIISSHPETAKEILAASSFSDRPMKESARLLMFERAMGFAPSGEYWRQLRRIAASHMFSPRRIQRLEGVRQRIGDEMEVGLWGEMVGRGVVELKGVLQRGALRNVVESVFGMVMGIGGEQDGDDEVELGLMINEGYDLIGSFNWEDYFPLKLLDFYGVKRRCHRLALKVRGLVGRVIRERREGGCDGLDDFLSVLLRLPKEEQLSDDDMVAVLWVTALTVVPAFEDQIRNACRTGNEFKGKSEMVFRGTDTVAILLEWAMARMVLHPEIQAKAQEELDRCVGPDGPVHDSHLPNLPYIQAIVKETLRMHPPGPLLSWARLAIHDVHVDKVLIPAGTTAMVNMWAIAHDPSIWAEPWAFRPERFVEEEVSVMGSDLRLAPFGSGRRVCPGKALGLATVHLWLARLLHRFEWRGAGAVDLSECLRLSMEMKKPLKCRISRRNSFSSGGVV